MRSHLSWCYWIFCYWPGIPRVQTDEISDNAPSNVDKLLAELAGVPEQQRGGGFHCAAVLVFPDSDKEPLAVEAVWRGNILRDRKGDGGFGYDPVFLDPSVGKTGAQMTREEKNRVSHRGKAFRELKDRLLQTLPLSQ